MEHVSFELLGFSNEEIENKKLESRKIIKRRAFLDFFYFPCIINIQITNMITNGRQLWKAHLYM